MLAYILLSIHYELENRIDQNKALFLSTSPSGNVSWIYFDERSIMVYTTPIVAWYLSKRFWINWSMVHSILMLVISQYRVITQIDKKLYVLRVTMLRFYEHAIVSRNKVDYEQNMFKQLTMLSGFSRSE